MTSQQQQWLSQLFEENPKALLADGFDCAFVGIGRRCGQRSLAVYSKSKAIAHLMETMDHEDALDYFGFNVEGGWLGEHTPIWLEDF
jgi:hypothetical protein